jgi:hypothetical protein
MKIRNIKVENMISPQSGREVPNQFIITTDDGVYFQNYNTVIAFRANKNPSNITLDVNSWDYSSTTSKYRNIFLGEDTAETRKNIKNGTYKLADLNK